MKKPDEIELWNKVKNKEQNKSIKWEKIGQYLGIPMKRLYYILDKWTDNDIIEYGVSVRYAWLTGKQLDVKK